MKKRSRNEMLDDARDELVSLRTVPDGGLGHTKTDELQLGNKRAECLIRSVTPELISVTGAVSLGANLAAYTDGFRLTLNSIRFFLDGDADMPLEWKEVRGNVEVSGVLAPLFGAVRDAKHIKVPTEAIMIAAYLRRELIEKYLSDKIKKEKPNE